MSGDPTKNPFEHLGVDPRSTPEAITEAMRELAEEANDDERRRLQGLWRDLTLHPEDRLRAAFFSHAHPSPKIQDLDAMAPEALSKRFRVASKPSGPPKRLDPSAAPEVADLVLLPALSPASGDTGQARAPWPDLDPNDDTLLKL